MSLAVKACAVSALLCISGFTGALFAQTAATSPAAPSAAAPSSSQSAPALPSVDEIIARYIQARGGEQKLAAINSVRIVRHVTERPTTGQPIEYDVAVELKRPATGRSETRTAQGLYSVTVVNGNAGWRATAGKPTVEPLTDLQATGFSTFSDAIEGEVTHYKEKGYIVTLRGLTQSQGKPCYGVLIQRPTGMSYRCFDATTFLSIEGRGENSTTTFSDFREIAGVSFAFHQETSSKEGTVISDIKTVEVNPTIADSEFTKPNPLPSPTTSTAKAGTPGATPYTGAITGEQVAEAKRQITDALAHVRTCPVGGLFAPVCSFTAPPSQLKLSHDRIEFWAPLRSKPHTVFIDLKTSPNLKAQPVRPFLAPPATFYAYFLPADKKFEKTSSDILVCWRTPQCLEWAESDSRYMGEFLSAYQVLKANAALPIDAEVKEDEDFKTRAAKWKDLAEKPPLPDGVHREEVLAKYAVTEEKNPESALMHFERGLAIEPLWPAGQLAAATICGELQKWGCAVDHGHKYLSLLPNGPQSDALRDKLIIWEDKLGRQ